MSKRERYHYAGPHACSKCGVMHSRNHSWCLDCIRDDSRRRRESRFERITKPVVSRAPPPPPGAEAFDLTIGRPWS